MIKVLILIGRPIYFLLTSLIIILYAIGYILAVVVKKVCELTKTKIFRKSFNLSLKILTTKVPLPRLKFVLIFFLLLLIPPIIYLKNVLSDLPTANELVTRDMEISTKIYDRNEILLYKIYKNKNRTLVPLSQIPLFVRQATLAAEDAEFYTHPGFSVRGIIRAGIRNLRRGELTGGSTITQQLVKNALLSSEKTLTRKIREMVLSLRVELAFSKDQILEMYLNEVAYGGPAYGIQEAASYYFGKNVNDLTLAEAALLAGLPVSPTKFSPFGVNPESARSRQKEVLNLMLINKFITKEKEEEIENENLNFALNKTEILAPHFVMYVREILEDKFGRELTEKGGLSVVTSLDYKIQKMAESVVKSEVEKLSKLNVRNSAALVLNPTNGEILAMVGSYDYFDTKADGNVNVALRPRQPGSSIKIVNYAYALSNGYTLATILHDTPITFKVDGLPSYSPSNYDRTYRGNLTLRSALAESRNVPAVKVLASYGVEKMIEMGKSLGITTWEEKNRFGLSLTLGGGEVKLIDLARAYATIANYGKRPEFISILKVANYKGRILEESKCNPPFCQGEVVLDPRVAFLLIDILRDNKARAPAFGSNSALVIPKHSEVAVKTGTSNDLRDNWTIGFNQKYLVAVWVGNNDNSKMSRIASGVTGASPIFNKIMSTLLANEPNMPTQADHDWEIPEGLEKVAICPYTATLACEGCPIKMEWFIKGTEPKTACNPENFTSPTPTP